MPRTHGYSQIGQRCFGTHDWGAKGRTNAIGALFGEHLLTLALFDCNIAKLTCFSYTFLHDIFTRFSKKSTINPN